MKHHLVLWRMALIVVLIASLVYVSRQTTARGPGGLESPEVVTDRALALLHAAGVRQVISSSGPMANIAATVNKLGIGDYFLGLMSGAQLARGKPHPDLFLNSAAAAESVPAVCIVVEDSSHGIEAARRAGMRSIAVGSLASGPQLPALLATVPGPTCLPAPTLVDLPWAAWEELWSAA